MPRTLVVHKLGHRVKVGRGFKNVPVCRSFSAVRWKRRSITSFRWANVTCKACLREKP